MSTREHLTDQNSLGTQKYRVIVGLLEDRTEVPCQETCEELEKFCPA